MRALSVNERRASDIEKIVSIGKEVLSRISKDLSQTPVSVDSDRLIEVFRSHVDLDSARILLSHTASLCALADAKGVESSTVIDALRKGLIEFGWDSEKISAFDEVRLEVQNIVSADGLYLSTKAIQLFGADSNHLHDLKIYTDSRPVFNRTRDKVVANIIFSTLSVVASDSSEKEVRLSVSMRHKDLQKLKGECEAAIKKIETYEANLSRDRDTRILVYGKSLGRT